MTLTEFLLARIAEDEAATNTASAPLYRQMFNGWHRGEVGGAFIGFTDRFTPARVLADCVAKRRIVEHCEYDHLTLSPGDPYVLQLLALPYADHPDYLQEWKP